MHPTARRCVWGAVVLWVAGAALVGFAPTLYDLADGWLGEAVNIVVGFLQEALVPTGAVLVGAAVVIQALRGTRPSAGAEVTVGSQASPVVGVPTAEPHPVTSPTPQPLSGAVPSAPMLSPVPTVPPMSSPVPTVPPMSSPVPTVPPMSSPVPTVEPVSGSTPSAGPALSGAGATPVASEKPSRGGRPRSRRGRG